MNAVDLIAHEATDLPEALQAEVLDFIGYLPQARETVARDAKLAELMVFLRPIARTSAALSSIGTRPMPGSFIDANVVLYTLSKDELKQRRALELLAGGGLISTQVLRIHIPSI